MTTKIATNLQPLVDDNGDFAGFKRTDTGAENLVPRTSTDASGNTVLVGADGAEYAALPVVGGNVVANVNHRTGTLASLLALAGGDGEISVATDVDAIVVHNGVALEAKPFYRSTKLGELHLHGTASNLTGGTDLHVDLVSKTVDFGGSVVDLANNKFAVPVGTKYVKCFLTVTPTDADVTAGTAFTAFIDYYIQALGNWSSNISDSVFSMSAPMTGTTKTVSMFGVTATDRSGTMDQSPDPTDGYLRIRLGHNDGTDVYAAVAVSAVFEFYGAN